LERVISGALDGDLTAFGAGHVDFSPALWHAQDRLAGLALEVAMRFAIAVLVFLQGEKGCKGAF
jgi:hypothetical protein